MSDQRIPLGDAAKLTGKSAARLLKMVEAGEIEARKTTSGQVRFSRSQLAAINPDLLLDKYDLTERYVRPKKLICARWQQRRDKGKLMQAYIRDIQACLGFCKGFQSDVAGSLSIMIDLMAAHSDDGGIPAEPVTYIAGMLGLASSRKWTQTIEPTLLKAGRIRKVTRNGIKVYVFPDDMMRGPKALFRPVEQVPQFSSLEAEMRAALAAKGPASLICFDDEQAQHEPIAPAGPQPVAPTPPAPAPVIEDATPVPDVPSHSAYQILKQAGVDVDSHERGEFFWHRTEHNEVLSRWLQEVPVNEIVVRIDKARIANKLPANPNSLLAYEGIVLGGAA